MQKGGEKVGKNPTDSGEPGSRCHLVPDRKGISLAIVLSALNVPDSKVFKELHEPSEPINKYPKGRPRKHSVKLHAAKASWTRFWEATQGV